MTRSLLIHWRWLTALSIVTACGDDGATVTGATDSETDADTSSTDTEGPSTITVTTDPDSSSTSTDESSTSPIDPDSGSSGDSGSTGIGELCGNGSIDDGEICDGQMLADATCESEGHLGGELACSDDCTSFDETGCFEMDCGDGEITGTEECDGDELGVATCMMQGFDAGPLACDPVTCEFDTSECILFSCGDGMINDVREDCDVLDFGAIDSCAALSLGAGTIACTGLCTIDDSGCCGSNTVGGSETCDGIAFNGQTCLLLDFDGGTLACDADCQGFNTSGCTTCGNSLIEGTEACDMGNLGTDDCTTVPGGFLGGTLACGSDCTFDTDGCDMCGNDVADFGEVCDGTDLGGSSCVIEGHTGGALGCVDCVLDQSQCTDFAAPGAGEVVITEIMQNPLAIDDGLGEWVELHNPSIAGTYQLLGCTVEDGTGTDSFTIDVDLPIGPGEYLSLARTSLAGFTADFVYPQFDFALGNTGDTVRLVCDAVEVDAVAYDGGPLFPDPDGASMQLDAPFLNTTDNDVGGNWCESFSGFGSGDFGTPGAANDGCVPPPSFTVDYCELQFPEVINEIEGTSVDVFGRLFIAGLTDQSPVNDTAFNVRGWVGYGPDGTDPAVDPNWLWFPAVSNPAWVGVGIPDQNNDEYMADLVVPATGTYDFAFRFSGDGLDGPFTYCDTDGTDAVDPYEIANAGAMTSTDGPTPSGLYFSEYVEGTSFNKAVEIYNPSAESVYLGQCTVRQYTNGAAAPTATITFPTTNIAAGDVFVVCNAVAGQMLNPLCDAFDGDLDFNGDDAVELFCEGAAIDVIGQTGFDPGTEWNVNATGTADETLRRDCVVTDGDPVGNDVFDPSVEWDSFPQNTFGGLGTRGCP